MLWRRSYILLLIILGKKEFAIKKGDTKRITVCAALAALGVILLYAGALIEVADISMAVVASLLCVVAVIEYGAVSAWSVFGVTSVLSLLLLPSKLPAVMYALFFGFYPILKEKIERMRSRVISWTVKVIIFNVCLVLIFLVSRFVMSTAELEISPVIYAVGAVLCEAVFILYDVAMTRLITFYFLRLRGRFKFK